MSWGPFPAEACLGRCLVSYMPYLRKATYLRLVRHILCTKKRRYRYELPTTGSTSRKLPKSFVPVVFFRLFGCPIIKRNLQTDLAFSVGFVPPSPTPITPTCTYGNFVKYGCTRPLGHADSCTQQSNTQQSSTLPVQHIVIL